MAEIVERFAPSPTGLLHLGHAYSALTAFDAAAAAGGRFLVRIEDLDAGRRREPFVTAIFEDLSWLGVDWERPVLRQSTRATAYADAVASLEARGLVYPCFCSRKEIAAAAAAPQEGVDAPAYPGTCRGLDAATVRARRAAGDLFVTRLDMRRAIAALGGRGVVSKLSFKEIGRGPNRERGRIGLSPDRLIEAHGDVALTSKDGSAAYHLAVVVDDAHQGVSRVTRGQDLFAATEIHRLLQALLGRPTPIYRHHALVRDATGRRLAKRADDVSLAALRAAGETPASIKARLAAVG